MDLSTGSNEFLSKRSTTNLLESLNDWIIVIVAYIDYSKAFYFSKRKQCSVNYRIIG